MALKIQETNELSSLTGYYFKIIGETHCQNIKILKTKN